MAFVMYYVALYINMDVYYSARLLVLYYYILYYTTYIQEVNAYYIMEVKLSEFSVRPCYVTLIKIIL